MSLVIPDQRRNLSVISVVVVSWPTESDIAYVCHSWRLGRGGSITFTLKLSK